MQSLHGWWFRKRSPVLAIAGPFGLCAALVLVQWWPGLVHGRIPVWGDALPFGWPLLQLHADALRGHGSLMWSDGIYGGHPIFAEGQGGFAHPLNILLASLVTPTLGAPFSAVLLHVTDLSCMALGMALLGRRIGLGVAATAFATLAVVFAPGVLMQQNNIAIGNTLGFVPLSLWAFERCLFEPTRRSVALLASTLSLLFLAGYPQTLHGLLIVMAARIAVAAAGRGVVLPWRALAGAALLFVALTAVQSLPLLQLARLSHRAGGVALINTLNWRSLLRGCAMGDLTPSGESLDDAFGVGSLLVWVPACLALLARCPGDISRRIRGYALGAVICMLAASGDTVLFPLLHGGLLPGMRLFRVTVLYPAIAAVPVALLAGLALDHLRSVPRWGVVCVASCWLAVLLALRTVLAPMAIGSATAGLLLLVWRPRRPVGAPSGLMLGLLLLDVVALRLHPFPFQPRSILAAPAKAIAVRNAADHPFERRSYGSSLRAIACMMLPHAPGELVGIRRMLDSLTPMTTLNWGIPSLDGALALKLQRRALAEPLLAAGLQPAGATANGAGGRLIDLLSVRFLVSDTPLAVPDVSVLRAGDDESAWVYENRAVRPFVQGFASHETVPDAAAAARRLATARAPTLVIEDPDRRAPADAPNRAVPEITLRRADQTVLRMAVRSNGPGWVVVADADYPGWSATIDGAPAPVFAAQLLAKAVPVPAGQHELVLRFRSLPMEIGLAISLVALGLTGVLLIKR